MSLSVENRPFVLTVENGPVVYQLLLKKINKAVDKNEKAVAELNANIQKIVGHNLHLRELSSFVDGIKATKTKVEQRVEKFNKNLEYINTTLDWLIQNIPDKKWVKKKEKVAQMNIATSTVDLKDYRMTISLKEGVMSTFSSSEPILEVMKEKEILHFVTLGMRKETKKKVKAANKYRSITSALFEMINAEIKENINLDSNIQELQGKYISLNGGICAYNKIVHNIKSLIENYRVLMDCCPIPTIQEKEDKKQTISKHDLDFMPSVVLTAKVIPATANGGKKHSLDEEEAAEALKDVANKRPRRSSHYELTSSIN